LLHIQLNMFNSIHIGSVTNHGRWWLWCVVIEWGAAGFNRPCKSWRWCWHCGVHGSVQDWWRSLHVYCIEWCRQWFTYCTDCCSWYIYLSLLVHRLTVFCRNGCFSFDVCVTCHHSAIAVKCTILNHLL